jgi:hypothetical protein
MKRLVSPLTLLTVVFVGPFVLAIVLYVGRDTFGGFELTPNPDRELIENAAVMPAIDVETADGVVSDVFRSRWSLIYARMPACGAACVEALERVHRVHLALGKERERVRLLFLAPVASLGATAAEGFLVAGLDAPEGAALARLLGPERLADGRYFVVDPLGNLILSYPADADQGRLLEDLERLLNVSRIG